MSYSEKSVIVKGVGAYVPEKRLTNDDLERIVDTSDSWIVTLTGISERRIAAENESTATMAVEAGRKAIEGAGLSEKAIDLLIIGTMTPDCPFPSTACIVQRELGLGHIPAFDVQASCSSFSYIMEVASKMLISGAYKNALIIGSDKMSSVLDWEDRATCILFGDGAGAAVLSLSDVPGVGLLGSSLGSDGNYFSLLNQPAGGSAMPTTASTLNQRLNCLKMNGKELFKVVIRFMECAIQETLSRYEISLDDVDCVIPHQANIRIIQALSSRLGVSLDKFVINLNKYGNTSAASIPIALEEALSLKKIQPGDIILVVSFGAGLTWGVSLIKWH